MGDAPKPLAYQAFRTVFGHLQMEKRIELVGKCKKATSALDKILPYPPFEFVYLRDNEVRINKMVHILEFELDEYSEPGAMVNEIIPDDIVVKDWIELFQVHNEPRGLYYRVARTDVNPIRSHFETFADQRMFPDMMRKLLCSYFDKQGTSRIKHLALRSLKGVYRLPAGIRLSVQKLTLECPNDGDETLKKFEPLLDDLPLECIVIFLANADNPVLQNRVFRSATSLELGSLVSSEEAAHIVMSLPNKMIRGYFDSVNEVHLLQIARNMIITGRTLNTRISISVSDFDSILNIQDELVENDGGIRGILNVPEYANTFFRHSCAVPLTNDTELVAFGSGKSESASCAFKFEDTYWLVLEVMKKGTSVPRDQFFS